MPEGSAGRKRIGETFDMLRAVTFDVLVVLGCRVRGGQLSDAARRRVERAAEAYRTEGASLVIASGGKRWDGFTESEVFARGLVERGVAPEHVVEERESLTTRGNARYVARLLAGKPPQRLALVTCDWHMQRALRLFKRLGITLTAVPAQTPPRPLHVAFTRSVRERVSLLLDLALRPFWLALLLLLLCSCSNPTNATNKPPQPSTTATARSAPQKLTSLLQAELRRDPTAVAEDELIAEDATRRLVAVRTLARIQDDRSFAVLTRALADEDPFVIGWAAFGVGQLCRGHEPEAVRSLVLRAASLATSPVSDEGDAALGSIAFALGRCASDEAERTLRGWLKLRRQLAEAATLGLGQVARERRRLDDATIAALLDAVEKTALSLYPIESLPGLGGAARQRLVEVASEVLDQPGERRAFAVRALAKGGPDAATPLRHLLEAEATSDGERADAARSLAAIGSAAQRDLGAALTSRARRLIDGKAWLTTEHGVVLTLLEGLEPGSADATLLTELSQLSLQGEPAPIVRRKVMLRCRAASLLAGKASASPPLLGCDPAPPAERREGSLALLKVLSRGSLAKARGARFQELARSNDRVVREAALELLTAHDEAENIAELLASALSAKEAGVRATAAKVLSRYPARAQQAPATQGDGKLDANAATPPADPRVVQALTKQLADVNASNTNIEVSSWLLDAGAALELLGAKPALERACGSANPTLRKHAEKDFALLGDREHHCPSVAGTDAWTAAPLGDFRLDFETDVGPLTLTLWGGISPFATTRFVELARAGFFDGMLVHRVVPGFVVQLGDPDGDGFGGPDLPPLRCQVSSDSFDVGSVGVALAGRDTGGSQLFVALRPAPHLAGEYSQIGQAEPGWERLAAGDRILKVHVLEAPAK